MKIATNEVISQIVKLVEQDENMGKVLVVVDRKNNRSSVINKLNTQIQSIVNPIDKSKKEVQIFGFIFRVGDRVIQSINNYHMSRYIKSDFVHDKYEINRYGVFNGEVGEIVNIAEKELGGKFEECVIVKYSEYYVFYKKEDLRELKLAYVLTNYSAQGINYAKFPVVIEAE